MNRLNQNDRIRYTRGDTVKLLVYFHLSVSLCIIVLALYVVFPPKDFPCN